MSFSDWLRLSLWKKHKWKYGRMRNVVGTWASGKCFWVLPSVHKCFYNLTETQTTCFLFLLENTATKKENNLFTLIIKMWILFGHAIITPTVHASLVFLWNYSNNIINQSAHIFVSKGTLYNVGKPKHTSRSAGLFS